MGCVPGRIRRCTVSDITASTAVNSHGIDIPQAVALGEALTHVPRELVVLSEIAIVCSVEHRGIASQRAWFV
jgi:hypothetical protein